MSRARALAAWIEINALWQADEEWREFIYKLSEPPGKLSDENQRRLERGLRHLNYVGLLADKRYFPLADFIESNYFPLLKIWCKSKPYILYERIRKGQDWLRYIDWLCGQAEDYRKRHRPSEEVKIYP